MGLEELFRLADEQSKRIQTYRTGTEAADEALKAAKANHILLKQTEATVQMNEQKVRQERAERLPHISIIAADHLDGPITIEVPVLDNNFNYWYVG